MIIPDVTAIPMNDSTGSSDDYVPLLEKEATKSDESNELLDDLEEEEAGPSKKSKRAKKSKGDLRREIMNRKEILEAKHTPIPVDGKQKAEKAADM